MKKYITIIAIIITNTIFASGDSTFFDVSCGNRNLKVAFERDLFDKAKKHFRFENLSDDEIFNNYDANGKKHGFWLLLIDKNFRITKNIKKTRWFKVESFWHGQNMSPRFEENYYKTAILSSNQMKNYPVSLDGKLTYQHKRQLVCTQEFQSGFFVDTLKYFRKDKALSYVYVFDLSDTTMLYEVLQVSTECGSWGVNGQCIIKNNKLVIERNELDSIRKNNITILVDQIGFAVPQKLADFVINDSLLVRMMFNEFVELDLPVNEILIRFKVGKSHNIVLGESKAILIVFNGKHVSDVKTIGKSDAENIILSRKLTRKSCENYVETFQIKEE